MKKKLLFIVNPFSGTRSKDRTVGLISQHISPDIFDYQVKFTEAKGHATELAAQAVAEAVDYVVAVGGDGTMNETARSLVGTTTALGIIPLGSGNGLARHLKIPMDTTAALRLINQARTLTIDSCTLNDIPFFCTAGVGFDAYIGQKFNDKKKRGFQTYVQTTINEFFTYSPDLYSLHLDEKTFEKKAFLITFANAGQYGNDAFIAPKASIQDGLLDVCVLEPFPATMAISIGLKLFNKTLDSSRYLHVSKVSEVSVERPAPAPVHLDGEPYLLEEKLYVKLLPASLKVLVPPTATVL